jgi:hypothetical protein
MPFSCSSTSQRATSTSLISVSCEGTVNLRSCGRSPNHISSYGTRDLVNRGGETAKIALGLLKLTVPLRGHGEVLYDGIVKLFENTCGSVDVSGLCGGT